MWLDSGSCVGLVLVRRGVVLTGEQWRVSPGPEKTACVAGTIDDGVCRRRRRSSACVAEEEDGGARHRSAWRRPRCSSELVAHGDTERVLRKTACVAGEEATACVAGEEEEGGVPEA